MKTRFGDFDCLGAIDGGRSFEDPLSASVLVDFEGRPLRILPLREILAIKTRLGVPKISRRFPTSVDDR